MFSFIKKLNLVDLNLSYNNLTSIEGLYDKQLNKTLKRLNLSNNLIKEFPKNFFEDLEYLDLSSNLFKFKGICQLGNYLQFAKLV